MLIFLRFVRNLFSLGIKGNLTVMSFSTLYPLFTELGLPGLSRQPELNEKFLRVYIKKRRWIRDRHWLAAEIIIELLREPYQRLGAPRFLPEHGHEASLAFLFSVGDGLIRWKKQGKLPEEEFGTMMNVISSNIELVKLELDEAS